MSLDMSYSTTSLNYAIYAHRLCFGRTFSLSRWLFFFWFSEIYKSDLARARKYWSLSLFFYARTGRKNTNFVR